MHQANSRAREHRGVFRYGVLKNKVRKGIMSSRFWLPVALLACATIAFAQLNTGTITGTVTDSSGAVVPNAKVTVRNTGTNVARDTVTSSAGVYTVPNLIVGTY